MTISTRIQRRFDAAQILDRNSAALLHCTGSRQHRRRIMAALRMASRIVVFGRMAHIGAVTGIGAATVMATGLLLPAPGHTQSTCQTGTAYQSVVANGGNCVMGPYDPTTNDGKVGQALVTGGNTVTLTTNGAKVVMTVGQPGANTMSLGNIHKEAYSLTQVDLKGKTNGIVTPDPITGGSVSVNTFSSATFTEKSAGQNSVPVGTNVNGNQYIDLRLGSAVGTDSTLKINLGNNIVPNSDENMLVTKGVKQTNYVEATNGGTVIWESKNRIYWNGNETNTYSAGTSSTPFTIDKIVTYKGDFIGLDNKAYRVTDLESLKLYNDTIIEQLKAGTLKSGNLKPQEVYDAAFRLAATFSATTFDITSTINATDEVTKPVGSINTMYVNGSGSKGIIAKSAELQISGAPLTADNNGHLIIETGAIVSGTFNTITAKNGARVTNNGVISGGFFHNKATDGTGNNLDTLYIGRTIDVTDAGSNFANHGILNLAGALANNYAINVSNKAIATNHQNMNIGVANNSGGNNEWLVGALVKGGDFTNTATGTIYIGRGAQYNPAAPEDTQDLAVKAETYGIRLDGATSGVGTNNGTITIGSKAQRVTAMAAMSGTKGLLRNNGTININGRVSGPSIQNIGMYIADSAAALENTGTININGLNGVGLKVIKNGNIATVASTSGTINVTGGIDHDTKLRNYGVWAEGAGATANVAGTVNLAGTGAIGVHARGGGIINLGNTGSIRFDAGKDKSGRDQIGVYVHGANSAINSAAANLDVSTLRSTLFLIASGASFSGGASAQLTGSGEDSTVIRVRDQGSKFASGAVTINLKGKNAVGVDIAGGATGTIDANAIINMQNSGVMAAIVDGQNYDINGKDIGKPVVGTSLISAAQLNSTQDDSVGYVAKNQAAFTNSGNINFTGKRGVGVSIQTGATGTNSGNISINNGGVGLHAIADEKYPVTTANNTGTITANGGDINVRTTAVLAVGQRAIANLNDGSKLILNGTGAVGAQALLGAQINIASSANPVFNGKDQIGFHAFGAGSTINNAATSLDASNENTTLFRIEDGATLRSAAHLTTSGRGSIGVNATGWDANIALTGGSLNVIGEKSTGFNVDGGAAGRIESGVMAKLTGKGAMLGLVRGQKYGLDGKPAGKLVDGSRLTNAASINVDGTDATAFATNYWGHFINEAGITMTGSNSTGVLVQSSGRFTNRGDIRVAHGTGVLIDGHAVLYENHNKIIASDGNAALELRNEAEIEINTGSYEGSGTAHAIRIGRVAGALRVGAIELTSRGTGNALDNSGDIARFGTFGTIINVEGSGAGIRTATSAVQSSTATINARGKSSIGYKFQKEDGQAAVAPLYAGAGLVINASGEKARGVLVNTHGLAEINAKIDVTGVAATGVELIDAKESLIGGQITVAAQSGPALKVLSRARVILTGNLTSASKAPVVDLATGTYGAKFTSVGTITAANSGDIAIKGSDQQDVVTLAGGSLTGIINLGRQSDELYWIGGTIDGAIEMGDGNDQLTLKDLGIAQLAKLRHLDAGKPNGIDKNDVLTFSNVRYKGGSFDKDDLSKGVNLMGGWDVINLSNGTDWTLTERLTLDDPTINIDETSVLRAGNGVRPVISATNYRVGLNNAGLIDLTNGSSGATDRLTLNGIYRGQGGTVALQTTLGQDNSATDRLIINGGTTGTARLAVTNLGGKGAMTNEGIEVITVNGASVGTFELIGDYVLNGKGTVVAGAYAYQLYKGNRTGTEKNNWYLRTKWDEPVIIVPPIITPPAKHRYQAGAASYETYPQALLALNSPATLQQRVGNRVWSGKANHVIVQGTDPVGSSQPVTEGDNALVNSNGVWGRIEGQYVNVAPHFSTSEMQFNQTLLRKQAGMDGKLAESEYGNLIGGLSVHYVHGKTATQSKFGNGEISTDGYGFGGSLTWYGENGFYLDSLAQVTWYNSDLSSKLARRGLTSGNDGFGYAFSLEAGRRLAIDGQWSLTPQAQLSFSSVTFDDFTDTFRAPVSLAKGDSLRGRLAITLDHQSSWRDASGLTTRAHLYGIANLYGEFLDGTKVKLADVDFLTRQDRLWGGLGFGGAYNWREDRYSLYGEGLVDSSLNNFSDSFRLKGNLGFRMKW